MKKTPTPEMHKLLISRAVRVLVQAFAGCGKTTSLEMLAETCPGEKILYLAYNTAIKEEAKGRFPRNVTCLTLHGLAWRAFGEAYKIAGKLGNVTPHALMERFGISALEARQTLDAIEAFLRSGDERLSLTHVAPTLGADHRAKVGVLAEKAWEEMKDLKAKLKMPHDGYFKLFQLSKPDLTSRFDTILLDEAQDANEVTLALLLPQKCRLIFVGDTHQSIYGFRGAVDALKKVKVDEALTLTHSFRFSKGIADVATALLASLKGEKLPLIGRGTTETGFTVDRSQPYAVITRTNGTLFREVVAALGRLKFTLIGVTPDFRDHPFEKLVDVHHILTGANALVRDQFLRSFKSSAQLEQYAEEVEDKELLMLLSVCRDYGSKIPGLVEQIKREAQQETPANAHLAFGTAHRTKGLEFNQVVLANDFETFIDEETMKLRRATTPELAQEANLLYVAVTRAKRNIELNSQIKKILAFLTASGFQLPVPEGVSAIEPSTLDPKWREAAAAANLEAQEARRASEALIVADQLGALAPTCMASDTGMLTNTEAESQAVRHHQAAADAILVPRADTINGLSNKERTRPYEQQLNDAILVNGLLGIDQIAEFLGRTAEETVQILGMQISKGRLSPRLFSFDSGLMAAAERARMNPSMMVSLSNVFL